MPILCNRTLLLIYYVNTHILYIIHTPILYLTLHYTLYRDHIVLLRHPLPLRPGLGQARHRHRPPVPGLYCQQVTLPQGR